MNVALIAIVHAVIIWGYSFFSKLFTLLEKEPYPADELYQWYIATYGYKMVSREKFQELEKNQKVSSFIFLPKNNNYAVSFHRYEDYAMFEEKQNLKFTWYIVVYAVLIVLALVFDGYYLALLLAYAGFGMGVLADQIKKHYLQKVQLRNDSFEAMFSPKAVFHRKLKLIEQSSVGFLRQNPIKDIQSQFERKVLDLYATLTEESANDAANEYPPEFIARMHAAGLSISTLRVVYYDSEFDKLINAKWNADHGTQENS